jgi:hypothetical protein
MARLKSAAERSNTNKLANDPKCVCGHPASWHSHPPDFGCPEEKNGCGCKGLTLPGEKTACVCCECGDCLAHKTAATVSIPEHNPPPSNVFAQKPPEETQTATPNAEVPQTSTTAPKKPEDYVNAQEKEPVELVRTDHNDKTVRAVYMLHDKPSGNLTAYRIVSGGNGYQAAQPQSKNFRTRKMLYEGIIVETFKSGVDFLRFTTNDNALREALKKATSRWHVNYDDQTNRFEVRYKENRTAAVNNREIDLPTVQKLVVGDRKSFVLTAFLGKQPIGRVRCYGTKREQMRGARLKVASVHPLWASTSLAKLLTNAAVRQAKSFGAEVVYDHAGTKLASPLHIGTPAFDNWFRGSKVVNPDGSPMRVYHGTKSSVDFDEFSVDGPVYDEEGEGPMSSGSGADPTAYMGAHFAQETETANQFALGKGWMRSRYDGDEEKPRVMALYLSIKNPKVFKREQDLHEFIMEGTISDDYALEVAMESDDVEPDSPEAEEWYDKYTSDRDFRVMQHDYILGSGFTGRGGSEEQQIEAAQELGAEARARLEKAGFDGVRYNNAVEGGISWIIFNPNQAKSAIANSGEFSKENNSIMASANLTDMPKFRQWFSGSVITNEDGTPKLVYHGTRENFSSFNNMSHFTDDPVVAHRYAAGYMSKHPDARIYAAYLRIKKPIDLFKPNESERVYEETGSWVDTDTILNPEELAELDFSLGHYDGIIAPHESGGGSRDGTTEYIAFKSSDVWIVSNEMIFGKKQASKLWYHGSKAKFDQFKTKSFAAVTTEVAEQPIFLSPSKQFAALHAGLHGYVYTVEADVHATFNGEKLVNWNEHYYYDPTTFPALGKKVYADIEANKIWPDGSNDPDGYFKAIAERHWDTMQCPAMVRWMKANGYDSFLEMGEGEVNMGVFDPAKLKIVAVEKIGEPEHKAATVKVAELKEAAQDFSKMFSQLEALMNPFITEDNDKLLAGLMDTPADPVKEEQKAKGKEYGIETNQDAEAYKKDLSAIADWFLKLETKIQDNLAWSKRVLKKDNWQSWYLSYFRAYIAAECGKPTFVSKHPEIRKQFSRLAVRYRDEILARNKDEEWTLDMFRVNPHNFQEELAHYRGTPYVKIQNYDPTAKSPKKVLRDLYTLDQEFAESRKSTISPREGSGDHIWMDFGNGWAWWLLPRASCEDEANAMGHCGNSPDKDKKTMSILSLRQKKKDTIKAVGEENVEKWKPWLTFILHRIGGEDSGTLGEMKGRGNAKPSPEFHKYIIPLLKDPRIKGIDGGGYKPENNFSPEDLTEEQREEITEANPGSLLTIKQYFDDYGFDGNLEARIMAAGGFIGSTYDGFIIKKWDTLEDYMKDVNATRQEQEVASCVSTGDCTFLVDKLVDSWEDYEADWSDPENREAFLRTLQDYIVKGTTDSGVTAETNINNLFSTWQKTPGKFLKDSQIQKLLEDGYIYSLSTREDPSTGENIESLHDLIGYYINSASYDSGSDGRIEHYGGGYCLTVDQYTIENDIRDGVDFTRTVDHISTPSGNMELGYDKGAFLDYIANHSNFRRYTSLKREEQGQGRLFPEPKNDQEAAQNGMHVSKLLRKNAVTLSDDAKAYLGMSGGSVVDEADIGDYELFVVKEPMVPGLYNLGIQRKGMDAFNMEQNGEDKNSYQGIGAGSRAELCQVLDRWLGKYKKLSIHSLSERKMQFYIVFLKRLGYQVTMGNLMGMEIPFVHGHSKPKTAALLPKEGVITVIIDNIIQHKATLLLDLGIPSCPQFQVSLPLDQTKEDKYVRKAFDVLLDSTSAFMLALDFKEQDIVGITTLAEKAFYALGTENATDAKMGDQDGIRVYEKAFKIPDNFHQAVADKIITAGAKVKRIPAVHQIDLNTAADPVQVVDIDGLLNAVRTQSVMNTPRPLQITFMERKTNRPDTIYKWKSKLFQAK